ncbi:hypothetical protein RF55_17562, partial [Lasius niger]
MSDIPEIEDFLYDLADEEISISHLCERALGTLALLENACLPDGLRSTRCAIRMTMASVIMTFRLADRLERSRSYLRARLTDIGGQFRTLSEEVSVLRAVSSSSSSSARGSVLGGSGGLDPATPSLIAAPLDMTPFNPEVSLMGASVLAPVDEPSFGWVNDERALTAEIQRSQSTIKRIDMEISAKKTVISEIDEAAAAALDDLMADQLLRIEDPISSDVCPSRAERARRRGEASRSRGGKPRIINQHDDKMAMDNDNEMNLPSQGEIGAPSDRCRGVPDAAASSSSEGVAEVLPAGASAAMATAETLADNSLVAPGQTDSLVGTPVNPLGPPSILGTTPMIFDDAMEDEPTCGTKRKAHSSPDNDNDKDKDGVTGVGGQTRRARKTRTLDDDSDEAPDGGEQCVLDNRECAISGTFLDKPITLRSGKVCTEDIEKSPSQLKKKIVENIIDSIVIDNSSGDEFVVPQKVKKLTKKKTNVKKNKPIRKAYSSSNLAAGGIYAIFDEKGLDSRFSREDLLNMGPSNLGSKGLDYVSEIDSMRASSSNLSGPLSGKMKNYLSFAKEVIRALVEKLETSGDVPHL